LFNLFSIDFSLYYRLLLFLPFAGEINIYPPYIVCMKNEYMAIWRHAIVLSAPRMLSRLPTLVWRVMCSMINTQAPAAPSSPSNGHHRRCLTTRASPQRAMCGHMVRILIIKITVWNGKLNNRRA